MKILDCYLPVTISICGSKNIYFIDENFFLCRPGFTLEETLQMAFEDNVEFSTIYMESPDPHTHTDEDSGEEDSGGLVSNLSKNQLLAEVQIVLPNNERLGGFPVRLSLKKKMIKKIFSR